MKKCKIIALIFSVSMLTTSCIENINNNVVNDIIEEVPIDSTEEVVEVDSNNSDEVVLGMKRPKTLNPLISNDISVTTTLKLVFQDIVSLSDDNKLQYNLITSYNYDEVSKTATVQLRDDVRWQGDLGYVNADDLIFSLNTLANAPEDAVYKSFFENISYYRKIDDRTVIFTLKTPMAGLPYFLEFPIIPREFFKNYSSIDGVHFEPLIGNGIYTNTYNTVNGYMILNDSEYDDIDANIDEISIRYIEDVEVMLHSFEQNKLKIIVENIQEWNKYHIDKEVSFTEYNNMELELLGFNHTKDYLNDINLKKAVELVIPYDQIINTIYLGFCNSSRTILPTNHFAYYTDINFEEENRDKALKFLEKSNYNSEPVSLIVSNSTVQNEKVGKLIVDNLREIGINASYVLVDGEVLNERIQSGDFDMFIGTYKMSTLPDYTYLFGKENTLGFESEALNALIDESKMVGDPYEYKNILTKLQIGVQNELPIIPLFHKNKALISDSDLVTFKPSSYNNPYGNFDRFIKKDSGFNE